MFGYSDAMLDIKLDMRMKIDKEVEKTLHPIIEKEVTNR